MEAEIGIDMKLKVVEFATTLSMTESGNFQAWGPIGPQTLTIPTLSRTCRFIRAAIATSENTPTPRSIGSPISRERRRTRPPPEGLPGSCHAISQDRAVIYLYHQRPLFALNKKVTDVDVSGDGYLISAT